MYFSIPSQVVLGWISLHQISLLILNNWGQKGCKPASCLVCWVYASSGKKYDLSHYSLPFCYRIVLQMQIYVKTVMFLHEHSNHLERVSTVQPGLITSYSLGEAEKWSECSFPISGQFECRQRIPILEQQKSCNLGYFQWRGQASNSNQLWLWFDGKKDIPTHSSPDFCKPS